MRELELIGTLGVIVICMLVATLLISDSVRRDQNQNFKAVLGIVLSGFASFGISVVLNQYSVSGMILFIVFLTIWEAQAGTAAYIGFAQRKIDLKKRYSH